MTEDEIVELIKNGDDSGMDALLRQYTPLMRYIISPILNNENDTEECIHDAAMRVWNKIFLFDADKGSFKRWLTSVSRNTALNFLKSRKVTEEIPEDMPSDDYTPEELAVKYEEQRALKQALDSLSLYDQALIYRKYYYMQSTLQISLELGLSERAVEGRLYRIKNKLRKMLGGDSLE